MTVGQSPQASPAARSRRGVRLRWAVAVAVLVVAAAVALWPREHGSPGATPSLGGPPPPDLVTLRERAALDPCPRGATPGAAEASAPGAPEASAPGHGVLAGISVPCLGDGATVPLGAALAGRTTLLNVWSHTCEPCRDELPALQEYAARPGAVAVLGVQVDGSPQAGLALLTALGVHLPSVTDADGAVRAALGAPPVLPLSYVVSADGTVRMVDPPVVFRTADEVDAALRRYRAGG